ncbi:hypothetical protein KGP93_19795 [Burkholderia multivorans]|nr:hypothetical protein [Burkholderia multivorans]
MFNHRLLAEYRSFPSTPCSVRERRVSDAGARGRPLVGTARGCQAGIIAPKGIPQYARRHIEQ